MKGRAANFDLLRIISTLAVITLHVTGRYVTAIYDSGSFGRLVQSNALFSVICAGMARFAVPCFLMLSGAFLLGDNRNADFDVFFSKSLKRIGIPTVVFGSLYIGYSLLKGALSSFLLHEEGFITCAISVIESCLCGAPFYHMWYMTVLLGLYLVTPVVIRIAENLRGGGYRLVS